ncbi:hypothetical protein AKO1_013923 [Acrasis kona]|uniref:PH domain-containing protein n=1 Tax=Acrasis kona TaxID=1008807 RepID=A0AAW2YSJ0_9EUKA
MKRANSAKAEIRKLNKEIETVPKVAASEVLKDADHVGHMTKQGGHFKSWKKRLCILHRGNLYYYKDKTDREPKGMISVIGLLCEEAENIRENALKIITPHRTYYTACESAREAKIWLEKINASAEYNASKMIRVVDHSTDGDAKYKTLQEALADANSGCVIQMRVGEYVHEGTIEIKKGVEVRGVYSDSSLVKIRSSTANLPIMHLSSKAESKLANLTLEYTSGSTTTDLEGSCLLIDGKSDLTNVEVCNSINSGIIIGSEATVTASTCFINGNKNHGIVLRQNANLSISRTRFYKNTGNGLLCSEGATVDINNCIFSESSLNGVRIETSSKEVKITKNKFSKNKKENISVDSKSSAMLSSNDML